MKFKERLFFGFLVMLASGIGIPFIPFLLITVSCGAFNVFDRGLGEGLFQSFFGFLYTIVVGILCYGAFLFWIFT